MRLITTICCSCFSLMLIAQDTLLAVYGNVLEAVSGDPIGLAQVAAYQPGDSSTAIHTHTASDGSFLLGIMEKGEHVIEFSADGHVSKRVLVVVEGPTPAQWRRGYGLSLEMSLFKDLPDLDLSLENRPVGKAVYDRATDVFIWDRGYGHDLRDRQRDLLRTYKQQLRKG